VPHCKTLLDAIGQMKATVLIGVSTIAGAFSQEVLKVRERGVFSGVG
jgi:malic enzyme